MTFFDKTDIFGSLKNRLMNFFSKDFITRSINRMYLKIKESFYWKFFYTFNEN